MQDRPTYSELLEAVQLFIETDAIPALNGPKKFHARVAANVLAIVRRELAHQDAQWRTEWERWIVDSGSQGSQLSTIHYRLHYSVGELPFL